MCGIVGPSSHTRIRVLQKWSLLLLSLTLPSEPSRVAHDATRLGRCAEVWRPMASMSQAAADGLGGGLENTDSPTTTSESTVSYLPPRTSASKGNLASLLYSLNWPIRKLVSPLVLAALAAASCPRAGGGAV